MISEQRTMHDSDVTHSCDVNWLYRRPVVPILTSDDVIMWYKALIMCLMEIPDGSFGLKNITSNKLRSEATHKNIIKLFHDGNKRPAEISHWKAERTNFIETEFIERKVHLVETPLEKRMSLIYLEVKTWLLNPRFACCHFISAGPVCNSLFVMFHRAAQRGGVQSHSQVVSPTFSSNKVKVKVHVTGSSEWREAHGFSQSLLKVDHVSSLKSSGGRLHTKESDV